MTRHFIGKKTWQSLAGFLMFAAAAGAMADETNVVSKPAGLIRLSVPANSQVLVSSPFNAFNGGIGSVFTNQLTGDTNENTADSISKWDPVFGSYTNAYKAGFTGDSSKDGRWFTDFSNWAESDFLFEPGEGFWIRNNHPATQTVFLCGSVVLDSSRTRTFMDGLTLFGYPFSSPISLNGAALANGANASTNPETADQIHAWDVSSGSYVQYGLSGDASWHSLTNWAGAPTEDSLTPGRGYWFRRSLSNSFDWTESRPYGNSFPANTNPPVIASMIINSNKNEVALTIDVTGAGGETLEVYYKDLAGNSAFDGGSNWLVAATNISSEGRTTIDWTDAGSAERVGINEVFTRMYLAARGDIDTDGDGIPDARETFVMGTSPTSGDTDGDGIPDGLEFTSGNNPLHADHYLRIDAASGTNAASTGFEPSEGYSLGSLNGQNGWVASGTAYVTDSDRYSGQQSGRLTGTTPADNYRNGMSWDMAAQGRNPVWLTFFTKPGQGTEGTHNSSGAAAFYFKDNRIRAYDGLLGTWRISQEFAPPSNGWFRVDLKLDYSTHKYLLCVNGILALEDVAFTSTNRSTLAKFKVTGGTCATTPPDTYVDQMRISTEEPAAELDFDNDGLSNAQEYQLGTDLRNPDTDGDGMPDAWEAANWLNPLVNDASSDDDNDGLTNLQEFQHGTNPQAADTDGDGLGDLMEINTSHTDPIKADTDGDSMPDGWETAHGFSPTNAVDAAQDADGDGMSNLEEYMFGTDPRDAASYGCSISGQISYTGPQTGLVRIAACTSPTGWTVARQVVNVSTGGYVINGLLLYSNYWVRAWCDTEGNGSNDSSEAQGVYAGNPVTLSSNVSGCNITLHDPDSDGDGYSDVDEVARGTDPADPESHPASHWRNRLKISFRDSAPTNSLSGVPILVRLTPERVDYSLCASDGRDLLFTDNNGVALPFEVERWSPGGESLFWVRLPAVGGTNAAGYFWLNYNFPDATNSANAAATWSTNYLGVWHLAGTNTVLADSAPGGYAATNMGAVSVTGILGSARNFRGSDSIVVPPAALAAISNAVSISFWQFGATNQPLNNTCFEGTSVMGRELNAHVTWGDANVYWDAFGNYDRINKLATTNLYKGGWNHWTFTKDRAAGTMRIYVNGELWHSGTGKTRAYTPVTVFRFGSYANGASGYMGLMDELRVESLAQSPDWIRFQYKSMLDQVLIYGEQQVSIAGTGNGAEPAQAGEFTLTRTAQSTNLALAVNLAAPGGTATEGADYTALPRTVVIPAGATQVAVPVPVMDDLLMEGAETVSVAIAQGNYYISPENASASISINDNDEDTDGDGMCDEWEIQHFGNLGQAATGDADNDGVNNLQEYLHGTNPNDADTDNDGLPDQWEIAMGTDPLTPDAGADPDHDGLTNLQEYQLGTNPLNPDTDGDGMPDGWEVDHGLNPLVNDAALDPDNDGLSNVNEFEAGTDPHNPDTDGDGLMDGAEVNTYKINPLNADTDGDRLPDKWEVDHETNPLVNDAVADPDGDGLSNLEEYQLGTDPMLADTDGDAIPDGAEARAHTNPLVGDFDGTRNALFTINGSAGTPIQGNWEVSGDWLSSVSAGGTVEYGVNVPQAGNFALEIEVAQANSFLTSGVFELSVSVDGGGFGPCLNVAVNGNSANGLFFPPPFTSDGSHTVQVKWSNARWDSVLRVVALRVLSLGGPDSNTNNVPDWVDNRLAGALSVVAPENSYVSPVCIEGSGWWVDSMVGQASCVQDGQTSNVVTVHRAVEPGWYANVLLSHTNDTAVSFMADNGALSWSNTVRWSAFNIISPPGTNAMRVRKGDALLLAASPSNAVPGTAVSFKVSVGSTVVTNLVTTAGQPIPYVFTNAGVFTVSGCYSNADITTNASMAVTVVGDAFTSMPVCLLNKVREWSCPGISTGTVVDTDSRLSVSRTLRGYTTIFALRTDAVGPRYMTARLWDHGPILDTIAVWGSVYDTTAYRGVDTIQTFDDGSRMIEIVLTMNPIPADLRINLHIFAGGVTFEDGSLDMVLTAADFDENGQCRYRVINGAGVLTALCHSTAIYQNDTYIGAP